MRPESDPDPMPEDDTRSDERESSPSRGGVFSGQVDPRMEAYGQSHTFDRVLYEQDIRGSIAHVRMLSKVGLLKRSEEETIRQALTEICKEIENGSFVFRTEYEDIHMNIEKRLEEKIGELAGKLHTARSRNDQISLDERLWIREEADELVGQLGQVQVALLAQAEKHAAAPMPGYTHMQRAQPVTCGHYLLAYMEMFERDKERFRFARKQANVLPLGCCALAGTGLKIDRRYVAQLLEFDGITRNSMDTSADRDYLFDFTYAMAVCGIHLSRLCEDFILFANQEFGFIKLADGFTTGSSIMPQKRNPDALELMRGKTGRAIGTLQHLFVLLKGLPLAYNRDLQEDKELLFDTTRHFKASLGILEALLPNVTFNTARMEAACDGGYMDATALAEYLVSVGVPFRKAHHIAGSVVRRAVEKGVAIADLPVEELRECHSLLGTEVLAVLGTKGALAHFSSEGSPNPALVRKEIGEWKERLRKEGLLPQRPQGDPA